MKRIFSIITITTLFFTQLFSQNDTEAKNLLDSFSKTMKSYTSITANFSFTLSNKAEKINDSYNGSITLQKNMYKVELMGAVAYCNGKTRWTHMLEQGDVNITEPDQNSEDVLENPQNIFTIYEKDFNYKKQTDIIIEGKSNYLIDLIPTSDEFSYSKISIAFSKQTKEPLEIKYYGKDGNNYTIKISSFTTNKQYQENYFVFDKSKFPNAEIIDMR